MNPQETQKRVIEETKKLAKVGADVVEGGAIMLGATAGLAARIAARLAKRVEQGYKSVNS